MNILVTGGAGFIGSNLVRHILFRESWTVINLDKLTYAGNMDSLSDVIGHERHIFVRGDIGDSTLVSSLLKKYTPRAVINLAAETHVDRSIDNPADFINTNISGTFQLLEATRSYWNFLSEEDKCRFRFLHVSTDEVYGSLGNEGYFTETSPYAPGSPYSASKASSDHLVRAYHATYGLPGIITNSSNNYGPFQFPEKLIPLMIEKILRSEKLPVYGDGANIRDWLFVEDHCRALISVLSRGTPGENYNIGGNCERSNLEVVENICDLLNKLKPDPMIKDFRKLIDFVGDRPGHDRRYAMDSGKIRKQTGWEPGETFQSGLEKTVRWYLENRSWVNRVTKGKYGMDRLGLGEQKYSMKGLIP